MRFISRFLILAGFVVFCPLSIVLILENWSSSIKTNVPISLKYDWYVHYVPIYLFWIGVILAIILVVLLLIALFWPRTQSLYLYQKSDGQVTVDKKAIEHFTLSALKSELFIDNPKVSAKLFRKRIIIKISGKLLNSLNAKKQAGYFMDRLKEDLRICLGISEKKKIKIRLGDFNDSKSQINNSRVI